MDRRHFQGTSRLRAYCNEAMETAIGHAGSYCPSLYRCTMKSNGLLALAKYFESIFDTLLQHSVYFPKFQTVGGVERRKDPNNNSSIE